MLQSGKYEGDITACWGSDRLAENFCAIPYARRESVRSNSWGSKPDTDTDTYQVVPNGGFADGGFSTSAIGTDIALDH